VFCTDIDGDGYMDVVTADKSKNATTLYYNNLVIATHTLPSGNNNSGAHTSSPYSGACVRQRSDFGPSDSHFPPIVCSAPAQSGWVGLYVDQDQNAPESVFVTDIDGNGYQDIVVAITGADTIKWYDTSDFYTWDAHAVGDATSTLQLHSFRHRRSSPSSLTIRNLCCCVSPPQALRTCMRATSTAIT
jgi:hypothetical protein